MFLYSRVCEYYHKCRYKAVNSIVNLSLESLGYVWCYFLFSESRNREEFYLFVGWCVLECQYAWFYFKRTNWGCEWIQNINITLTFAKPLDINYLIYLLLYIKLSMNRERQICYVILMDINWNWILVKLELSISSLGGDFFFSTCS